VLDGAPLAGFEQERDRLEALMRRGVPPSAKLAQSSSVAER
jgi:hypothetical protein